ncbi:uncharacterized protein PRCAT00006183001 [Priceomyces carsonii]|uniref:uncharacterized protein n=1 Tax=Priceomyces carsonii TaxID=28549 RepID=UPI002ED7C591|nr:unnamed protein product [Priceomyces carsonii]
MTGPGVFRLNNGNEIPQIGLGCWQIPRLYCAELIYNAIKVGYRLFDGAQDYENEEEVGEGIKRAIEEDIVKREELTIVSKLWNSFHAKENVKPACLKILEDLKIDYLDVLYMHFPICQKHVPIEEIYPPLNYCGDGDNWRYEDVPIIETWRAMEDLVKEGLVKSIGISNFNGALLQDLLRQCKIKPQILQIEHHPYLSQPRLIEYCKSVGIQVTAYSSFGFQSYGTDIEVVKHIDSLLRHPTVNDIAKNHNKSPGSILLRWSTQREIAVIPKSSSIKRLAENLEVNAFTLSDDEISEINGLNRDLRFNDPWDWDKIPTFI